MASFGENLRKERELRGVSLQEIAEETKIGVRFLRAIEEGRFDLLPGGLFPRCFVRQYAECIGLDPEVAVADFLRQSQPNEAAVTTEPARRRRGLPLGLGFFTVVAAVGVGLSLRHAGVTSATTASSAAPQPAAAPIEASGPAAAQTGDAGLVLSLTARQECWVEVQADGLTVLSRTLQKGESETLGAKGEISLAVGNAGGLVISINDRPAVSLGSSGEVRRVTITRDTLPMFVERDSPNHSPHS